MINKIHHRQGLTLVEILIVITLLAVLFFLSFMVYSSQVSKAYDAKKKDDLERLRFALQEYYENNQCFPAGLNCGQPFLPYLETVPCDPQTGRPYLYLAEAAACPNWFKLYSQLRNAQDPAIAKIGCSAGVDPSGTGVSYNYGVSSTNVRVCEGAAASPPPSGSPAGSPAGSPPASPSPSPEVPYTSCFGTECQEIAGPGVCDVYFNNLTCSGGCVDSYGQPLPEKQCH